MQLEKVVNQLFGAFPVGRPDTIAGCTYVYFSKCVIVPNRSQIMWEGAPELREWCWRKEAFLGRLGRIGCRSRLRFSGQEGLIVLSYSGSTLSKSKSKSKFPRYSMKCRGKHDTAWNIPRTITFLRYISCYIAENRFHLGQCRCCVLLNEDGKGF